MKKAILSTAAVVLSLLSACVSGNASSDTATSETSATSASVTTVTTTAPAASETLALPIVYDIDPEKPVIALTFDDGPNITTTFSVLKVLEKYQVRASFFLIGNNINESSAKMVKRAYDMGCEIDNHSQTHSYMNSMSPEDISAEVKSVSDRVMEITGEPTKFFRPPYIAVNGDMYDNIDMPFICGIGCNDWDSNVSVQERIDGILGQVQDGTIILLHDAQGNSKTVEALDTIIPTLLEEGYQFATVSELFEAKGVPVSPDDMELYSLVSAYQ